MKKVFLLVIFIFQLYLPAFALESAKVMYVVDGDTLKVFYHDNVEKVRLLGIDCPEVEVNQRVYLQAQSKRLPIREVIKEGRIAKAFVKSQVHKGDTVYLEGDSEPRDKYNRILAYVFLQNGKMLNEEILKNGCADLFIIRKLKYKNELIKAYRAGKYSR